MRVDPHSFTGVYESVEKDTVAYGLGMYVHTRMTHGSSRRDMVWYVCC
jgi:hypothetical protein